MLKKILDNQKVRYVLIGGSSYLFELLVIFFLIHISHISAPLATAISFWVGLLTSFSLQRTLAFKSYSREMKLVAKQFTSFLGLVLFNYIFTLLVVTILPDNYIFASRTLALAITTLWNYVFYKKLFAGTLPSLITRKKILPIKNYFVKTKQLLKRRWKLILLLTLPVLLFNWVHITTFSRLYDGDFDYFAQMYEAFRISVLKFHQFPWWNPWMSGGVPLLANPQFGLFSIQSVLVLLFGAVYGLKLTYVVYAVLGFWGMFLLVRKDFGATLLRSSLVAYLWIFSGFFASHGIFHFTFALFYLLPWIIFLINRWRNKYSWLWLGLLVSVITLSSVHYALLMMGFAAATYIFSLLISSGAWKNTSRHAVKVATIFFVKTVGVITLVSGYRFITTYLFLSNNERSSALLYEAPLSIGIVFKALFLPIGTILKTPATRWSWGEYSMYIGLGSSIAVAIISLTLIQQLVYKRSVSTILRNPSLVAAILLLGTVSFSIAFGDFGKFSLNNILHELPGFTETRVSARWLLFSTFSILCVFGAWKRQKYFINVLLLFAVAELALYYGFLQKQNFATITTPPVTFSGEFKQFSNGKQHLDFPKDISHSYYHKTTQNIGDIYADDAIVNTLNSIVPTTKCAENIDAGCDFIDSDNAAIVYWSPNKIELKRTKPGPIILNMNVEEGWRINGTSPFYGKQLIDPTVPFSIPADKETHYTVEYLPRLSPERILQKIHR